jgi:hypothetical protein
VSGGYNKGMATEKAHNDMEYAAIAAFEHFTFAFSDGGFVIANPMMIDDGRWCQVWRFNLSDPPTLNLLDPPKSQPWTLNLNPRRVLFEPRTLIIKAHARHH